MPARRGISCASPTPATTRPSPRAQALDYWLPVDLYTGGIEHARSHLLYARFWTKVLFDEGLLGFEEPFLHPAQPGLAAGHDPRPPAAAAGAGRRRRGKIIDWIVLKHDEREQYPADQVVWRWARMSKSKGNVVTPDEITERYGADSLRVYEMFVAPFEDDVQWSEEGIQGSHRFVTRAWRWLQAALPLYRRDWRQAPAGRGCRRGAPACAASCTRRCRRWGRRSRPSSSTRPWPPSWSC